MYRARERGAEAPLENQLQQGLDRLGMALPAEAPARLLQYVRLMFKWNRVYNLTAVRDARQMISRHILDSLVVLPHIHGHRVLDVGTGAGLPGIPLAIACPEREFVLLDSNGKKCRFVTQATAELGLANVTVVRSRVEHYRTPQLFDTIISRAYSSVTGLVESAGGLGAAGVRLLAMKGVYPVAELEELPAGYRLVEVTPLRVPGLDAERHLVVIQQDEHTTGGPGRT